MGPDLVVVSKTAEQIVIEAGNWICTYISLNGKLVRQEKSRDRYDSANRPDHLIKLADKLAREWFAAQRGKEKVWERKSHASGDGRCSS